MIMEIPSELLEKISEQSVSPPSKAVSLLVDEILASYGEAVQGILFYGSCLHKGEDLEGLFDLYVLVNRYDSVNRNSMQAALNKLLPPNVFYLEVPLGEQTGDQKGDQTVRAKYAVLSLDDLQKGTSRRWFHSYLWARFCQPTTIVYLRDGKVAERVNQAFAQAVVTFVSRVLPRMPQEFTIRDLWSTGLALTYRSEFRPEQADQQVRLFDARPDYFKEVTCRAFDGSPYQVKRVHNQESSLYSVIIPNSVRFLSRLTWALRIVQGKVLSVLRLVKGTLTFDGGVDYILWKIKRHSGVSQEASPFLKRQPVLAICVLYLRLYRQGGVR
jgi:hypothetical protein